MNGNAGLLDGVRRVGARFRHLTVDGRAGALNPSRYVGATTGGAPTAGSFIKGDWVIDLTNALIWFCTANGSPGTWTTLGSPPGLFGDGSTAAATITSNTSLSADAYYTNLTISGSSVALSVNSQRVFVKNTLTIGDTCSLNADGLSGSTSQTGAGFQGSNTGTIGRGASGGTGAGGAGGAGTQAWPNTGWPTISGAGGAGGAGGSGPAAGGAGGAVGTLPTEYQTPRNLLNASMLWSETAVWSGSVVILGLTGGSGGGAGGGDGTAFGAGGGGAAGVLVVFARQIILQGSGRISANGGNGGSRVGAGGNPGGGGGGGGGTVVVVAQSITGNTSQITANGGAGGAGIGTGLVGSAGANGTVILMVGS